MTTATHPPTHSPSPSFPPIHPSLKNFDELPDSAYVPLQTVCALLSCSTATVWRRVRSGQLVPPVRIGARTTRWNVAALRRTLSAITSTEDRS